MTSADIADFADRNMTSDDCMPDCCFPFVTSAKSADHDRYRGRHSARRGLTRGEIITLVVISLVAAAIFLPWLANSQRQARRVTCSARLEDAAETLLFAAELRDGKELPGYVNELAVDA